MNKLLIISIFLILLRIYVCYADSECTARWSEFKTRFSFLRGCEVEVNGVWFSDDRIKEADIVIRDFKVSN